MGNLARRNREMQALHERFGRALVTVEVDGRPVNTCAPFPTSIGQGRPGSASAVKPGRGSAKYVRLSSKGPAFSTCVPAVHHPRWVHIEPDSSLLQISARVGGGLFYTLDFGEKGVDFVVEERHWPSWRALLTRGSPHPQKPRAIAVLRDFGLFRGESELSITPSHDFTSIRPEGTGSFYLSYVDLWWATYPQLCAQIYLSYDCQSTGSPGTLGVFQDGLLHDPVTISVPGLTIYAAAEGLPTDANGLTLVRGAELEKLLAELSQVLKAWLGGCLKHPVWEVETRSDLERLAQLPSLKFWP